MSGGSFNYIGFTLRNECSDKLEDDIMNELLDDFIIILHNIEWWKSGDYEEIDYRNSVNVFKEKWLK
jgi:hypothetical protein